ncbi:MAG: hypothetical protein WDO12_08935 [Pseudomonadota bacterium]
MLCKILKSLIVSVTLVVIADDSSGATPGYIPKNHSTLLENWLQSRPDLRFATDDDCKCDDDLASLRSDMSDLNYHPYYLSGDLNGDGKTDLALLVVSKVDASKRYLVVFNGPLTSGSKPAFFGAANGILVLSSASSLPRKLFVGPPYSEAAVLEPQGSGYKLVWEEEDD